MLTRVGSCRLRAGGRCLAGLLVLGLGACAVDSLDRLGAGRTDPGALGADAGPDLSDPLRPGSRALDASAATGPTQLDPALLQPGDDGGIGVPSASGELLPDPGFEAGHEGWYGRGASRVLDVLEAHGGSRAILSTNRAARSEGPAYDIQSLVRPWRPYAVSAWVRNELDTHMVMLTLEQVCNGRQTRLRLATRAVGTRWLQLTSGFFVPECPTGLERLTLYVEGPPAFKNLLVDDVSLQEVRLSGEAAASEDAGSGESTTDPSGGACKGKVSGHASTNDRPSSNPSCNGNPSP